MKFKPTDNSIAVKVTIEEKIYKGIELPNSVKKKTMLGEVVNIGANVKGIEVGMVVAFKTVASTVSEKDNDHEYRMVSEKKVLFYKLKN